MSQDPNGHSPAAGNVVRGEVIAGDEGDVARPAMPMTEFRKVASGDRKDWTDPSIPVVTAGDAGADGTAGPADSQTDPDAPGFVPGRHAADETSPEDVVAVRSPDADDRDYWDDEADDPDETGLAQTAGQAGPDATQAQDPAQAEAAPEPDLDAAGAPVTAPAEALRPGEPDGDLADFRDLTFGSLLPDAAGFRARWQQVQFRFVDDPQGSVTEAADVISQLTAQLEAAIAERQRAIAERQRALRDRWGEGMSADTESLRGTLLMYRAFLDQLAGSDGRVS